MNKVRLSYSPHPTKDNYLISLNILTSKTTGIRYEVHLDLENMVGMIKDVDSSSFVFKSNRYTNLNVLKRVLRDKLIDKGVPLKTEVRNRTFGLCPKGYNEAIHRINKKIQK